MSKQLYHRIVIQIVQILQDVSDVQVFSSSFWGQPRSWDPYRTMRLGKLIGSVIWLRMNKPFLLDMRVIFFWGNLSISRLKKPWINFTLFSSSVGSKSNGPRSIFLCQCTVLLPLPPRTSSFLPHVSPAQPPSIAPRGLWALSRTVCRAAIAPAGLPLNLERSNRRRPPCSLPHQNPLNLVLPSIGDIADVSSLAPGRSCPRARRRRHFGLGASPRIDSHDLNFQATEELQNCFVLLGLALFRFLLYFRMTVNKPVIIYRRVNP